jgi:ribosomal protein L7/L12
MDKSLLISMFGIAIVVIATQKATSSRIARIEHKLNLLLQEGGIDLTKRVPLSDRVKDIARDPARTIEAIKAYRDETGADLKEAKDAIDAHRNAH